MDNRRIAKSAFNIGIVTFISRLLGLVREWLRGYLLGTTGSSDAFSLAFMFPNLMRRLVGEGALVVAFIPIFSDYLEKEQHDEMERFVHSFFTLLLCFLIISVGIVVFAAPVLRYFLPRYTEISGKIELTIFLTRLMFPYILFISLAALTQAILNTYKVFVPSALTPIFLNICIIVVGFLLGTRMTDPSVALGIGVLIGGGCQLLFQIPFLRRKGIMYKLSFRFKNPGVRRVFLLMIPAAIGGGVYQINALVSQFIAATLEEGSVAALRFSHTLVEVVLGVFIISLSTVILPALSEKSSKGDIEGMKETVNFALRLSFLITLPSTFGLIILRYPIVRMLFRYGRFTENSTQMVAYALLFQAIGLCAVGGMRVLAQMFYSLKDTKTPVIIAGITMVINIGLCVLLSRRLQLGGIALAGSVSAFCNFILLFIILTGRVGHIVDKRTGYALLKSFAASICMTAVLYFFTDLLGEMMARGRLYNVFLTLLLLLAGIMIYFVMNIILKNRDIVELKKILINRISLRNR
ncbi:MAG: murein biosynthesis integral membrane protein MurJ [Spirochaetota bacterium]|nr:MAG: murein biosynthesis integral membrane protein MurJ [Spirochaetota bacterium]